MSGDATVDTGDAPITGAVVERIAEGVDPPADAVVDALLALTAELPGRHAAFGRSTDSVTVDGKRAYRIDRDEWATLVDDFGFDEAVVAAVRLAHTEQARLLFAAAVGADDRFSPDEVGVVVGLDTAEQF